MKTKRAKSYNGTEYYYLRNAQGDIVMLIDADGEPVVEYIYDTWGKAVQTTNTLAATLGTLQPFRYRGYVYDEETGLYYLQSRYYDPTVCRFISADMLLSTGQGVMGHNAFAYCLGNPVGLIDTLGQRPAKGMNNPDGDDEYDPIAKIVLEWSDKNVPLTQKDHLERGGIIVSTFWNGRRQYSVVYTSPCENGTCWEDFVLGYLIGISVTGYTIEGFVHTHSAYPPEEENGDWNTVDGGPSDTDLSLFKFPGIKRQFIANEKGGIYEFDINYKDTEQPTEILRFPNDGSPVIGY